MPRFCSVSLLKIMCLYAKISKFNRIPPHHVSLGLAGRVVVGLYGGLN